MGIETKRRPLLHWPFILGWRLATFTANLTGILLALGLGLVLMVIGMVFIQSIIGAIIGVPLFAFGFLLVLRGLY